MFARMIVTVSEYYKNSGIPIFINVIFKLPHRNLRRSDLHAVYYILTYNISSQLHMLFGVNVVHIFESLTQLFIQKCI